MKHALCLAPFLASCATTQPAVELRTVEIPTPVPCLHEDQIPLEPGKVGSMLNGNAAHDLPIVAASALELRKWGGELMALVQGCVRHYVANAPSALQVPLP